MKPVRWAICLVTIAAALPALADEVGKSQRLVSRSYRRYELEKPRTPQEARRAALERANDQLLFGFNDGGAKPHTATRPGGSDQSPTLVAAAKGFWSAAMTLGAATLGFVTKYFSFVFWVAVALGAVCRAIASCLQ
jgi:hypothetical protein